jgi:hypothetical protein
MMNDFETNNEALHGLNDFDADNNCLPTNTSSYYNETEINSLISNDTTINDRLSLFFLNIRSIVSNYESLSNYLNSINLNCLVLGFVETWLKPDT